MDKRTSDTIRAYNTMGKQYLADIEALIPFERDEFVKSLKPGSRILDVGCAGGRDSEFFVHHGFEVFGIDLSDVFLQEAKKRVPEATFVSMDATQLDFPQENFDGIWANAVLLHIAKKDISGVLQKMHRMLKANGILHIRVKEGVGETSVKDTLSKDVARTFTFFSKMEIEELVLASGFASVRSQIITDETRREGVNWISLFATKK
ncbi:MAG: methyltransferase domain-containing protein [Patescibacteria group bacterium]